MELNSPRGCRDLSPASQVLPEAHTVLRGLCCWQGQPHAPWGVQPRPATQGTREEAANHTGYGIGEQLQSYAGELSPGLPRDPARLHSRREAAQAGTGAVLPAFFPVQSLPMLERCSAEGLGLLQPTWQAGRSSHLDFAVLHADRLFFGIG